MTSLCDNNVKCDCFYVNNVFYCTISSNYYYHHPTKKHTNTLSILYTISSNIIEIKISVTN
jgi:hypothetical protein